MLKVTSTARNHQAPLNAKIWHMALRYTAAVILGILTAPIAALGYILIISSDGYPDFE
jgi:hypothetical protein